MAARYRSTILRRGKSGSQGGDTSDVIVVVIGLFVACWVVSWPYWLGTWIAVMMGAQNPSTDRTTTGWVFEAIWLVFLIPFLGWKWLSLERENKEKLRRERAEQQREVNLGADGVRVFKEAQAAVASISRSEAARSGWLGEGPEFDFQPDLDAIEYNLGRANEIRRVTVDAASIKKLTKSDARMLKDAQRSVVKFDAAVSDRIKLIKSCAELAGEIDRALREERENVVMEKRREELRDRLTPILYNTVTAPSQEPSEAADIVSARVAAFHELKALSDKRRIEE